MMNRIAKLLNQAERADEGSPEREAFMERAMTLSQAHSIDLAIARAHTVKKERVEVPEKRSFKVGHDRLKASKNAHFVDLMIAICDTNDIEVTISGSNMYVFGVGMPSDLDLAEKFFSLLAPQMVAEADAGLKRGDNGEWRDGEPKRRRVEIPEEERAWGQHDGSRDGHSEAFYYDEKDEDLIEDGKGGWLRQRTDWSDPNWGRSTWVKSYPPPRFRNEVVTDDEGNVVTERKWVSVEDGRVWRVNFYQGFVNRARSRLREAKKQAFLDAGIDYEDDSDSRSIAIRDKKKEVRDVFEKENRYVLSTGRTYGGAQVSSYAHGGQMAGDAAGQRATLGNEKDLGRG
jgi:hypothetical protein